MLKELIADVADTLKADPYFADITVLAEDEKDFNNQVATAIGARSGLVVVIITPSASAQWKNIPGPYFSSIKFTVHVAENVTLNRNGGVNKPALEVAEYVVAVMHLTRNEGFSESIVCSDPTIIRASPHNATPSVMVNGSDVAFDCNFQTLGGVSYSTPQLDEIVVSYDSGNATLLCSESHAVIVYSLNGKYPSPRNAVLGDAQWYSAPFAVATDQRLMARAWLPGYRASALTNVIVP